jgi:hypothetical protein
VNVDHRLNLYFVRQKVAGSRPDEVNFSIYLILLSALGPRVYSASNRNEYLKHIIIKSLGSIVLPVRRTDNLTAICESIVYAMWYP